ncbi:MAG: hypothetical protein HFJ27_01455 [Clostridia bacterium]|nr:hypothetical protein [Clostridia bacterium]
MKKLLEKNLPAVEITILLIISIIMGNKILQSIIIIGAFMLMRTYLGAKHYDNPLTCITMTTLVITSILIFAKTQFEWAILFSIFGGIVLSNEKHYFSSKKLLQEGFMYKLKGDTKYDKIDKIKKINPNLEKLKQYEKKLKEHEDKKIYEIYKIRFCEPVETGQIPSLRMIEERTKVSDRRIVEYLDKILFAFEIYCEIKK